MKTTPKPGSSKPKTTGTTGTNQYGVKGSRKKRGQSANTGKGRKKLSAAARAKKAEAAKQKKADLISQLANDVIESLDEAIAMGETGEWTPPWRSMAFPTNAHSNHRYTGSNFMLLSMSGNEGPFMTYNQADKLGLQVRANVEASDTVTEAEAAKQNEAYKILIGRPWKSVEKDKDGNPVIDPSTGKPKKISGVSFSTTTVFPLSRCDDKEGKEGRKEAVRERHAAQYKNNQPIEEAQKIVDALDLTIEPSKHAAYSPTRDVVKMPDITSFDSPEAYYSTLLHECVHRTGHPDRENRGTLANYTKDVAHRAEEELIAEIGSAMLMTHLGLDEPQRKDHHQYLIAWRNAIADDPNVITRAASGAKKAVNSLLAEAGMSLNEPIEEK